ncbi:MAG: sporulation integral membrane protein YtvI [Oscillospiraceae bacterium]|jgi:sporulation integral membrane protein YtvI
MPENKHLRLLLCLLYIALGMAGLWVFLKFLLPWTLPFLISLVLARSVQPLIRRLSSGGHLPRSLASALSITAVLLAFLCIIVLIVSRVVYELTSLVSSLPALLAGLPSLASDLEARIYRFILSMPSALQDFLFRAFDQLLERGINIPSALYEKLLSLMGSIAGSLPKILLFFVTTVLATYFIGGSYDDVMKFIMRQIPPKWHEKVMRTKGRLQLTLGQWLKAQLLLMVIVFCLISIGLLLLGIRYAVLAAAAIAIIDVLPVLGSGMVLIPWALIEFIRCSGKGLGLLVLYGLVALTRSFAEPRLVGKRIGLNPLVTLLAIYIGYRSIGVFGMLLFPIVFIMLKEVQEWGYIKIWK